MFVSVPLEIFVTTEFETWSIGVVGVFHGGQDLHVVTKNCTDYP